MNAPENKDTDFSWREFVYSHNSELLGGFGNLVNRTFKFIERYFENELPQGAIDPYLRQRVKTLFQEVGVLIEKTHFKQALEAIFVFVRVMNKYFDDQQPWKQRTENPGSCKNTLATCVYVIRNLAILLSPFLPFSSENIQKMLGDHPERWEPTEVTSEKLGQVEPLYERIDPSQIEHERAKLTKQAGLL
jgi:methionyl-tRNA synthetase